MEFWGELIREVDIMKQRIRRFNCFIVVLAICVITTLPGRNSAKVAAI